MADRQYQSFTAGAGDSLSVEKLKKLRLPDLNGKSFLDLGCNEGFFCGYAAAQGSSSVLGVDHDAEFIKRARLRFPSVSFKHESWDQLTGLMYDVVLLASALHYAEDQEAFIHKLMTMITHDGIVVLEVGMAPGSQSEWVSHDRHDGARLYATRSMFESILRSYAYKLVGPSVNQTGDAIERWVWHIRLKRPVVMILASSSYSGKSTLSRSFSTAGVVVCELDKSLLEIFTRPPVNDLGACIRKIRKRFNPTLQGDKIIESLFDAGVGTEFITQALGGGKADVTIVDGYIPDQYLAGLFSGLECAGYIVWNASPIRHIGEVAVSQPMVVDLGSEIMFLSKSRELYGKIDRIGEKDGYTLIAGWAVNSREKDRVDEFAVLLDGKIKKCEISRTRRPDLEELNYIETGVEAGFELRLREPVSSDANLKIYLVGEERRVYEIRK